MLNCHIQACTAQPAVVHRPACTRPSTPAAHRQHLSRPCCTPITQVQSVSQQSVAAAVSPSQQAAGGPDTLHPEAWQQCVQRVQNMGFDEVQAGTYVQRAFGWGAKARSYWRHEKVRQKCGDMLLPGPDWVIPRCCLQLLICLQQLECSPGSCCLAIVDLGPFSRLQ